MIAETQRVILSFGVSLLCPRRCYNMGIEAKQINAQKHKT